MQPPRRARPFPSSNARAEASRQNGAKSRGPKTPEGRARSAQNALKHGMRAQKHLVLPDEDGAEFRALEAALVEELAAGRRAPARARAARRGRGLASRAGGPHRSRAVRGAPQRDGGLGLALIRDGNGPRSFETLLRYRGAAMAEFWRALRTLKALQAEQAAMDLQEAVPAPVPPLRTAARPRLAHRLQPNEPERAPCREYLAGAPPAPGALHEPAAPWLPNEPESAADQAVIT